MPDTTRPVETQPERAPIDANALEAMARERPDEKFLKGTGVLKLISAIRQLEGELRTLRMADPVAGMSRELLGKIVDEAFGGSIEDTTPIEDIALSKRALAVAAGAIEITDREATAIARRCIAAIEAAKGGTT